MKKLSAVLCTHNPREAYLRRTLDALSSQTLPVDDWELLLIDNASDVPLAGAVDLGRHRNARHVREEALGLTPARLCGIRESAGEVLVFVDDDTVLAPDYLEQALVVAGEWPFVGAWGGSVIPEFEVPLPSWCGAESWRLTIVEVTQDVWSNVRDSFATIPVGAGMCIRRDVGLRYLEWCGNNRRSGALDRIGKALSGYGDVDLAHCAIDMGLGTGKSTRLRLTHLIPASRLTLDYFVRHAEGDAISLMMFRAVRGLPLPAPPPRSIVHGIRWWLHSIRTGVPREIMAIQRAHRRGIEQGFKLAREYLAARSLRHPTG